MRDKVVQYVNRRRASQTSSAQSASTPILRSRTSKVSQHITPSLLTSKTLTMSPFAAMPSSKEYGSASSRIFKGLAHEVQWPCVCGENTECGHFYAVARACHDLDRKRPDWKASQPIGTQAERIQVKIIAHTFVCWHTFDTTLYPVPLRQASEPLSEQSADSQRYFYIPQLLASSRAQAPTSYAGFVN